MISYGPLCFDDGIYNYYEQTIKYIGDLPPGSMETICGDDVPAGWVITERFSSCGVAGNQTFEGLVITKTEGLPAGSVVELCGTQAIPIGWVISDRGEVCHSYSIFEYRTMWITNCEGLPAGSVVELCGSQPIPEGWVISERGGICHSYSIFEYNSMWITKYD